jgi:hypothetical protein
MAKLPVSAGELKGGGSEKKLFIKHEWNGEAYTFEQATPWGSIGRVLYLLSPRRIVSALRVSASIEISFASASNNRLAAARFSSPPVFNASSTSVPSNFFCSNSNASACLVPSPPLPVRRLIGVPMMPSP